MKEFTNSQTAKVEILYVNCEKYFIYFAPVRLNDSTNSYNFFALVVKICSLSIDVKFYGVLFCGFFP